MDIAEDPVMTNLVNRYTSVLEKSLEKCIGVMHTKLDGRFKMVRSRETELGNFVADIMASVTRADVVLINSGTFRSDGVHTSGDFRLHDLMTILPINDCVVSIVVTGAQLLEALENGVGVVPKYEGRFPQVSGVTFGFNPGAKPGCRVIQETVRVQGKPLDLERRYTMATKAYVARGKDGYSGLSKCQILTDPDSGPLLSTVVRNHIMNVSKLLEFEKNRNCKISISKDGRKVVCDDATLDPSHAFNETDIEEFEEPISAIQRDMKPVIDGNNNPGYAGNSPVSTLHLPTFISMGAVTDPDDVAGQKIEALRKKALSGNTGNNKLLAERSADPTQLRWQVLPLLEARIFHCESFAA
uniref:5'-Nucleotidase C-terminal domain-containing protein n=1 Tax=Ciona savignyi TaxID=51511 RepID=H2YPK7_CIOSA